MTDEGYYDICCVLSLCYRGAEDLSDLDLERILSFDMGWLSPEDAETAVSALIDKGWLIGSRDELTLAGEIVNNAILSSLWVILILTWLSLIFKSYHYCG